MSLNIPPAVNYPSPLISTPARYKNTPREGTRMVPVEIDWGSMGGASKCVSFNLALSGAQTMSQISAITADNSASSTDVQIIFTDSQQTYTLPAYSPSVVIPVFTNSLQFYVVAPGAIATDVTRFAVHNDVPPPSNVGVTTEQQIATAGTVLTANGTTNLIPAGNNGRVEAIYVQGQFTGAANGSAIVQILDGNNNVLATSQVSSNNTTNVNVQVFALSNLALRFVNGLNFKVLSSTLSGGNSAFAVNVYYRQP